MRYRYLGRLARSTKAMKLVCRHEFGSFLIRAAVQRQLVVVAQRRHAVAASGGGARSPRN